MAEKISEYYKCSGLHEIEQIAMRSVCREMSSNRFMILFRVEIDYSRPKTSLSEKNSLSTGVCICLVELLPGGNVEPEGASKNKKILLILIITSLFGLQTSVRTVAS